MIKDTVKQTETHMKGAILALEEHLAGRLQAVQVGLGQPVGTLTVGDRHAQRQPVRNSARESCVASLDAQAHPERHRDLIVRVAGYSAFFNVLSKATQDDIIARTEQTL